VEKLYLQCCLPHLLKWMSRWIVECLDGWMHGWVNGGVDKRMGLKFWDYQQERGKQEKKNMKQLRHSHMNTILSIIVFLQFSSLQTLGVCLHVYAYI